MRVDADATARAALRLGRGGSPPGALLAQLDMLLNSADVTPMIALDSNAMSAYLDALAELNVEPRDVSVSLDGLNVVVTPAQNGRDLDATATLAALTDAVRLVQPAAGAGLFPRR